MWKGRLNLSLDEFLVMTEGEISDLIDAYIISEGIAEYEDPNEKEYIPDMR